MKRFALSTTESMNVPDVYAGTLTNSSENLVERARRGDEAAFQCIFDRYARPVLSFIYDMVGERQLAEELAQETFVRAYKNLVSMRDETKLSTWLFGIAKNVAREALRTRCRDAGKVAPHTAAVLEIISGAASPDDQLINKELNSVIHDALAALDTDKRLIFTLKVFHGQSYEEIARITGFSIPKLKTDLHRARIEMRRRIAPYLEVAQ